MKLKKIIFLFVFAFVGVITSNKIFAQDLNAHFHHLNSKNGLSSNSLRCLFKDHNGFLWIGTHSGLNRFDGKNIVSFIHQPNDSMSLINDDIQEICEDGSGRIWIATQGGLSVFNPFKNNFNNYLTAKNDTQTIHLNEGVVAVSFFKNKIYITTHTGIFWTSPDTVNIVALSIEKNLHSTKKQIRGMPNLSFATAHGLFISTFSGLFYSQDGINFFNKENNPKKWQIFNRGIMSSFCNDGDSICWFTTFSSPILYHFRFASMQLDSVVFPKLHGGFLLAVCKINADEVWAGTITRGVLIMNLKTKEIRFLEPVFGEAGSLSGSEIDAMLLDDEGTLFITTDRGLDYVNPSQAAFTSFSQRDGKPIPFLKSMLYSIAQTDSLTWFATFTDGLYSFNSENGNYHHYTFPDDYNNMWYIRNEGNKFLLGSYGGIGWFDLKTKQFSPIELPKKLDDFTHNGITFILPDKNGDYWIGLWQSGLLKYNLQSKKYIFYSKNDSLNKLSGTTPYQGFIDEKNRLWFGYMEYAEINCLDISTGKFSVYKFREDIKGRNDGYITALKMDNQGNLWAGTSQEGVLFFNPEKKITKHFTTAEGLSNNLVTFIQFDEDENIWVGTLNGLNKLIPSSGKITSYSYSDGLPGNDFAYGISHLMNGEIITVADLSVVKFNPKNVFENKFFPKVQLLFYEKSGIKYFFQHNENEISVSYKDKTFRVNFTAINFIDADKTQFAYKLENYDNDWNYVGTQSFATFTSLPAGDYVLKIKATNKRGNWNVNETAITLHVSGPFWKTWWFFFLCLCTVGGISYLIYYMRLRQILEIQNIRNKISKDLHDDIGSALSSISIYGEVAKKMSEEKTPEVISILDSLQETAKSAMENMSDIVWAINPKNDRFNNIIDRLEIFSNQILNAKGINLHLNINDSLRTQKLTMQQRKNIYLICKEAINNVAKYSEAQNCFFELNKDENSFSIKIKDDGKGIDEEKKSLGGNGLINMKKRATDIKGILNIFSEKNKGTILSLNFML